MFMVAIQIRFNHGYKVAEVILLGLESNIHVQCVCHSLTDSVSYNNIICMYILGLSNRKKFLGSHVLYLQCNYCTHTLFGMLHS